MRLNLPVTAVEQTFGEQQRLISATDVNSHITYCNAEFAAMSGFTQAELIGSTHNLVRHPDMPPAVFQLMWSYLKAGQSWMGVVKNRCKNGNYYWVSAYVTPILEDGRLTGYESVRVKPTREQVRRAEALYARLQAGGAAVSPVRRVASVSRAMALPLAAAVASVAAFQWVPGVWAQALTVGLFLGLGVWGHQRLGLQLKQIVQNTPNTFSDPISAMTYSDALGPTAQLEMILISEEARLKTALTRLSDLANQMAEAAAHSSVLSSTTESALLEQRAETDMTAAAMTEMAASIAEVAVHVQQTASEAHTANTLAEQGSQVAGTSREAIQLLAGTVTQINQAVGNLAGQTQQIQVAASMIQAIADQTNLLALNAAIEAARAGEQGRGFAVVADEVRALAGKTRESTQQIQGIIQNLRAGADEAVEIASLGIHEAEQGVQQVLEAQQALQGIRHAVERITGMSQQMAAASQEQSHVAEEVSQQINNVAATVQKTAGNANAAVTRGRELESISSGLRALVERFNR
ncbi:methyl-accepting chemotaxis protein [Pseudomonas sp. NPDC087814]|uniref:methyl-accepting chemotaxis protein n=2 Tax=Pseudomonas TaxID=286 RepID=UPI000281CB85|nr:MULTISPECIES: PAS domain-containing methyl-accepting chemotaxis protein [Pseudomonas]NWA31580.1 methyl-accepting chemotaxis protein [Pseudomonas sp. C6002]NWB42386.1 methyl-accepting chemotaxis protein [Pseudomonas sp. E6002]NWB68964.1 methyl-accepting chemotaxis protein [Pseudomonas sp. I8001]NWB74831.1 methyl-accepting chemotaxis protein [Pseudomonas sp. G5001]NWC70284.1 methyl-accepting chemotaxis protein [Pseudomonas sp. P7758]NWD61340.1 methyl-accepting chemotaxis protein [Pseudomonas